ncbi:MAG: SCO family protein [Gemmatimonadota bacterium]|nr:SCO family protein [Gemmatimonadota bacterium]
MSYQIKPLLKLCSLACASVLISSLSSCGIPADGSSLGELRGTVMEVPIPKPDLVLTDTEGELYDLRAETDGYLSLVFFGYTNCPDVCPVHMATLAGVFDELAPEVRDAMKVIFVSTDPERDTPDRLRQWLRAYHPSFLGLRGEMETINAALAEMKLPGVAVVPGQHGSEPIIGHPSAVLAFGRDGLARVRYPFGVRRADWVNDLPLLLGESP